MSTQATLDSRYGRSPVQRRRGRRNAITAVAVAVLLVVGWAVWTGVGGTASPLEADTVSARTGETSTEVRWLVTGRASEELVCAIEARDLSGVVVGLQEVVVPVTGRADRAGDTVVRTVRPASSGLIVSCRAA